MSFIGPLWMLGNRGCCWVVSLGGWRIGAPTHPPFGVWTTQDESHQLSTLSNKCFELGPWMQLIHSALYICYALFSPSEKEDDNQGKRSTEKRSIEIAALLASVSKVVWSCHQLSSTNLFLPPTLLRIHFAHFSGLLTDDSCLLAKDRNYYFKNSPARGGY